MPAAEVMERPTSRFIATTIVRPDSLRMPLRGFAPKHEEPRFLRREADRFTVHWRSELMFVRGCIINDAVEEVLGKVVRFPDGKTLGPNQFIDEVAGGIKVIVEKVPPEVALRARVEMNSRAW